MEAENSLFSFRYGESSGESKKLIAENVVGEVLVEVETTSPAAPTDTMEQQACVDTSKLRIKKGTRPKGLTSNMLVRELKFEDLNPNYAGDCNIYSNDIGNHLERRAAVIVVRWAFKQSCTVAIKRQLVLTCDSLIRTQLAVKLRKKVKAKNWSGLLRGCRDLEIAATVTSFDIQHVYARTSRPAHRNGFRGGT